MLGLVSWAGKVRHHVDSFNDLAASDAFKQYHYLNFISDSTQLEMHRNHMDAQLNMTLFKHKCLPSSPPKDALREAADMATRGATQTQIPRRLVLPDPVEMYPMTINQYYDDLSEASR